MAFCEPDANQAQALRSDIMTAWLEKEWQANHPDEDWATVWTSEEVLHHQAIDRLDRDMDMGGGFKFVDYRPIECDVVTKTRHYNEDGEVTYQTGAYVFTFRSTEPAIEVEVPVLCTHYADNGWYYITMAGVTEEFLPVFATFTAECQRLTYALEPSSRVVVIGGHRQSFEPNVAWDEIVLPQQLKQDIFDDVQSFFSRGAEVYASLNLKPFRKLLLAGVPGTGKTMLCNALAKWALDEKYLVIYVSSARKKREDRFGSTFDKIDHALSVAASSSVPTLIILEELDAYLHEDEKALILNVLDGSEGAINEHGTLLIATTNYPEAIDDRVMKRPGRLDRVFVVPETRREEDAEKMLRQYLDKMWQDEHMALVPSLVGYPGAFIREVCVYALTQVAYGDLDELPLAILEKSYRGLKEQIDARDDLLKKRGKVGFASKNGSL
ncbi:MAG: ATP-binding protein [Chloroflexota bacterium]